MRPFLQFLLFAGAFYISLSRITDNRHHPTDVIAGILVGLFFAAIILLFLADIFNRPLSFQVKYKQVMEDEVDLKQVVVDQTMACSGGGSTDVRPAAAGTATTTVASRDK